MGAWGVGLYQDDTTCDVRTKFKNLLESGFSHVEAEKAILDSYASVLSDTQIACLVYFSLADVEWKYGGLSEHVKLRSLALLADGDDLSGWEEDSPSDARARAKILSALASKLLTPQPPLKLLKLKVLKAPRKRIESPVGTVFGLQLPNGGVAALKFVGLIPVGNFLEAMFRLLPWSGEVMASASVLEDISHRTVIFACNHHEFSIDMDRRKKATTYLLETNIVLSESLPIDMSRWVSLPIGSLPEEVQNALENPLS